MAKKLSPEATRLYRKIREEWAIEDAAGLFLLTTAMEAFSEMRAAEEIIERDGMIVKDRFQQDKLHPAAQRQKECRAHMLQAFKQLGLDLESIQGIGRAPKT